MYDNNMENRKTLETFSLSIITDNEAQTVKIEKFSSEDGEYVLVLAQKIIYIWTKDGEKLGSQDISSYLNGGAYYSLIPLEKDSSNNLCYYIGFLDTSTKDIKLVSFSYQLSSNTNSHLSTKNYIPVTSTRNLLAIAGISCEILLPSSSSNKVITCFYFISANEELNAITFDSFSSLTEKNEYSQNLRIFKQINHLKTITICNKKKVFIVVMSSVNCFNTN